MLVSSTTRLTLLYFVMKLSLFNIVLSAFALSAVLAAPTSETAKSRDTNSKELDVNAPLQAFAWLKLVDHQY